MTSVMRTSYCASNSYLKRSNIAIINEYWNELIVSGPLGHSTIRSACSYCFCFLAFYWVCLKNVLNWFWIRGQNKQPFKSSPLCKIHWLTNKIWNTQCWSKYGETKNWKRFESNWLKVRTSVNEMQLHQSKS